MHPTPIGKSVIIEKSWTISDTTFIEGWLSTPTRDLEKDVIEPEAFIDAMENYFERRAPLSYIHERYTLPAGHLQKAAIVRAGNILKEATHPTDPAGFDYFQERGTGVYVRAAVTDPVAGAAIKKGNVGSFSFIGMAAGYPFPDGGKHYREKAVSTWIESTIAPYPVNPTAVITLAKAYGYEATSPAIEKEQPLPMNETSIRNTVTEALKDIFATAQPLTKADVERIRDDLSAALDQKFDEKLTKALELDRGEGQGRKGQVQRQEEKNEVAEMLRKARAGEGFTREEELMLNQLTYAALIDGLKDR